MRIDKYLAQKYGSRTKAARAVEEGLVLVNGKAVSPSYEVRELDGFTFVEKELDFVSLGGFKLEKAINDFGFDVDGKVFADVGASTGGFTDCLFKHGAKKVYCIDVGNSQLDKSLLDKNVVVIDNFNARELTAKMFDDVLDGAVIDVSFISLTYILGGVAAAVKDGGQIIALIKPQFECESKKVGKNGIVKDSKVKLGIIKKIYDYALKCNLAPVNLTSAPIVEGKNTEYLIHLVKGGRAEKAEKIINCANL